MPPAEPSPGTLRPARPDEVAALSALAQRSKAHWGYDEAQMAVFRGELTLTPRELLEHDAFVLEEAGRVLGFYTLAPFEEGVELGHLFVEPSSLRRGAGRRLLDHAVRRVREAGFPELVIQSDPNAEGFYRARGARKERDIPTSIRGRTLPLMRLPVGAGGTR